MLKKYSIAAIAHCTPKRKRKSIKLQLLNIFLRETPAFSFYQINKLIKNIRFHNIFVNYGILSLEFWIPKWIPQDPKMDPTGTKNVPHRIQKWIPPDPKMDSTGSKNGSHWIQK
jgi:hypothetical protein